MKNNFLYYPNFSPPLFSDRVAITYGENTYRYRDLDRVTNGITKYLLSSGIRKGDVVAIRLENQFYVICSMLACLKIGCVYVYINSNFPDSFQNYMIRDSKAKIVLNELPKFTDEHIECKNFNFHADELAYVMYTSGTTGESKGVGVSRCALNNYIEHCVNNYFISTSNDVLLHGSLSCDMHITTIFPSLYLGKRIFILNQDFTEHSLKLHKDKFALAKVTPSHIRLMMKFNKMDLLNFTDTLIIGGEELTEPILKFCKEKMPNTLLINEYGPTETTVGVTTGENATHIGKPISNTSVYILDKDLNVVKNGEIGQIYISGQQLARGYFENPNLTAEKFIANPFISDGSRMYCTGDLAKKDHDGNLVYLGRIDSQVKVNGYRIEVKEIESKLIETGILQDVFIKSDTDEDGNSFLVAYYIVDPKTDFHFSAKWREVYEDIYEDQFSSTVNNIGWTNSYDNSLLSIEELKEWRDELVTKVLAYEHMNIFEIGCGTGMIAMALQKFCNRYIGIDFSKNVIKKLTEFFQLNKLTNIDLYVAEASKSIDILANYDSDMVILNSVIQYFPNAKYLEDLLVDICLCSGKQKSIYVGDIRDFRLADDFYESLKRVNFKQDIVEKDLICFQRQNEKELLISPEFFFHLSNKLKCVSYIEYLPKQGMYLNELNLFRYDVIIHINRNVIDEFIPEYNCSELEMFLNKCLDDKFIIRSYFVKHWEEHVKSAYANSHEKKLTHINDIKLLAKKQGYNVYISLSVNSKYSLDLLFSKHKIIQNDIAILCKNRIYYTENACISNEPDKNIPAYYFKNFLKDRLPSYMIPLLFIKLDNINLKNTGKINTGTLPKISPRVKTQHYNKPKKKLERKIAKIWQKLLVVTDIGRNDDFWELGGNSLIAMQLISEINYEFDVECRLKDIFSHTTLKELSDLISEKRKISKLTLNEKSQETVNSLSSSQESLWFLQEVNSNKNAYHAYFAAHIYGDFNSNIFEECLSDIIQRHEQLRICVLNKYGKPFQQIKDALVDYLEEDAAFNNIKYLVNREISRPFDLTKNKLFRVRRLKISAHDSVLVFTWHHIIADGWSIGILISELNFFYNSKILNSIPMLPELKYSYFDYIKWQNDFQKTANFNQQVSYWEKKLENTPIVPLNLSSKTRSQIIDYCGDNYSVIISKDTYDKLKIFSQDMKTSIFIVLISLFQFSLSKFSGENDIIVGVPIANRKLKEFEGVFGLFVNTIPIRTVFDHNYTFKDFLKLRSEQLVSDYENQDVPFETIVNAVGGDRSMSYNPIFQIMFVFQNTKEVSLNLFGTTSKRMNLSSQSAKCDIVLIATEEEDIIQLNYEYATSLFDDEYIKNLNSFFQKTIDFAINNPNKYLSDVYCSTQEISSQEHHIECSLKSIVCTEHGFNDKIAVIYKDKHFSYEFIDSASDLLKCYLYQNKIGIGDVVALSLKDPVEFIIAIWGIVKIGAIYLPIDESTPIDRKKWMLTNSQAKVILDNLEFLSYQESVKISTNPEIKSFCPAYIIYTSGSTGRPKGVVITQENVLTTLLFLKNKYSISCGDVVLALSTFCFDLSVFDVFGTFLSYGTVVVPKDKKDPCEWYKLLKHFRVSVWNSVPALMELLLSLAERIPESLRLVFLSGDKISSSLKGNLKELSDNQNLEIISLGGATECSIWSISYDMSEFNSLTMSYVPYGKALKDQSIYVLDNFLQLTADGAKGEIFIGGNGVGSCYINQPDLTAERFIASPFGDGKRLYRTGDLGMVIRGEVHILGRIDDQIKFNGFRIELKEIEMNILDCSQVKSVNVILKIEDKKKRIIAFIVPLDIYSDKPDLEITLKKQLSSKLPDYMIPQEFIFLDEMPLTSNKKIDLNFLSNLVKTSENERFELPKTDIEKTICKVWGDLLVNKLISINDNFFQLGGDSIIAIQIVSRLKLQGINFSVKDIFLHQTIKELALFADSIDKKDQEVNEHYFDQEFSDAINLLLENQDA